MVTGESFVGRAFWHSPAGQDSGCPVQLGNELRRESTGDIGVSVTQSDAPRGGWQPEGNA